MLKNDDLTTDINVIKLENKLNLNNLQRGILIRRRLPRYVSRGQRINPPFDRSFVVDCLIDCIKPAKMLIRLAATTVKTRIYWAA